MTHERTVQDVRRTVVNSLLSPPGWLAKSVRTSSFVFDLEIEKCYSFYLQSGNVHALEPPHITENAHFTVRCLRQKLITRYKMPVTILHCARVSKPSVMGHRLSRLDVIKDN